MPKDMIRKNKQTMFQVILLMLSVKLFDSAKIKQSNECTTDEVDKNVQCFQEVPEAVYEVSEGSIATLRCIVRNQHGKVQWRAVPVLLGYDRNIPGRPRYRYVGSVVKGEHHLEIRDVKKDDSGMFECQVQPVGDLHPLLRRKTELIVLVRPTDPQIFYRGVKIHNDQVVINSLSPDIRSVFLCISLSGHPPPAFKWFINNDPIVNSINSALVESLKSTRSKLSILTKNLKDGDVVRCRVSNRATEKDPELTKQYLDKEIVIVIHTAPGPPAIIEMTQPQGSTYTEGEIVKGTCISSPPGKPAGSIIWRWKLPISSQQFNNYQRENFTTKDVPSQHYQQLISRNQVISKLDLPALSSQFHGAQLICVAMNTVTSIQSTPVNILIKYPPSEVKISTPDGSLVTRTIGNDGLTEAVIFGESGEVKSITCTTAKYYSEAMLKWQIHHSPSLEDALPKRIAFAPVEKVWKDGESYRRNSTIKVTIDRQFDKSYLDCQAWSDGKRVDTRVKLDITYPAEKPIITGYHSDSPVKLNKVIELTCSTIGGNPFPDLQWFRNSKPIQNQYPAQQTGNQKSIKIRIIPSKLENNAKYFCQAKSLSSKVAPMNSEEFRLVVLFPPAEITLSSLSGSEVEDGNVLILQCLAGESNPPAVVRWKMIRCGQMMLELGGRTGQKNCDEETLQSSSHKLLAGNFGGKRLKSNVEIRTTWRDHMDYVDCEVYNPDYGEDRQVLRKRVQMNVTFVPKFEGIVSQNIMIEENQSKTFNIEPIANPPVYRYNWLKDSMELGDTVKSVTGVKTKFIIQKASATDSGNYTLVVTNDRGEARVVLYLNVTYRPLILGDKFEVVVNNRQNADLECPVKANPANPYQSYRWIKLVPERGFNDIYHSDLIEAFSIGCNQAELKGKQEKSNFKYFTKCYVKSQYEMNSMLIVYDLDRNDVGIYKCVVNNGVGGIVTKTVELIKYFTPQILSLPKYSKAAGSPGQSVSLICFIRAEPKPKLSWYFGKYNISIKANAKYRLNVTRLRPGFYVSHLTLLDIQRYDHGRYFCKAENEKGSDTKMIDVSETSTPDVPMEIQIVNKTMDSIMVSWVQGFDGGSPQTFQIRWKEERQNSLYRYEDVASDDRKTVLEFVINELKSDTLYHIDINSRNPKHGKSAFSKSLAVSTFPMHSDIDQSLGDFRTMTEDNKLQDNTVLFIVAASVFGFVILVVNVLVIVFVLRRRRQRSRTAKLEARYTNPKSLLAASNGLILSREDQMRESNSNFLRSDAVELYPRGLDTSQMSHHTHPLNSLRRSIPDDQKTFSSFETGSDDAREDLLRRQKEFGCCGMDPSAQKGSIILAYDPINNCSYYAPVDGKSTTPAYMPTGLYNQDTMSTILSPNHKGVQRQLMYIVPFNNHRGSSSCGSVHSGGGSNGGNMACPQSSGNYVTTNISPSGSIIVPELRAPMSYSTPGDQFYHQDMCVVSANADNNAPHRTGMMSPNYIGYPITQAQHKDTYANDVMKGQRPGNIVLNPVMFSHNSATTTTTKPHVMINPGSLLSSPINHANGQFVAASYNNRSPTEHCCNTLSSLNSPTTATPDKQQFCHKYRCTDTDNYTTAATKILDNTSMDDPATHLSNSICRESQYLPQTNLI